MTAHSRFRIAAMVGALLAPLALVAIASAPAEAASKHKHEVYMYKVEKNLRLAGVGPDGFGDSPSPSLSCYGSDIALDGMWNVKHVDQYHPFDPNDDPDEDPEYPSTETLGGIYNDERDVFVEASFPSTDPTTPGTWHFRFDNRAYGDAQVKLFVTCIRDYVENTNGHNHKVKVRSFGAFYNTTAHPDYAGRTKWDSTNDFYCTKDEYYVAPGFDLGSTVDDHRLVASYPVNSGKSWAWEFASFDPDSLNDPSGQPGGTGPINPAGGESIAFYGKCIERQTGISGHRHAIVMKHLPAPDWQPDGFGDDGYLVNIPLGDAKEVQYSCDTDYWQYSGYKAMVGWFYMTDYWEHNWFYGMEPRPKTRVWQFWNGHSVSAKVRLGVLCINSRTANPTI